MGRIVGLAVTILEGTYVALKYEHGTVWCALYVLICLLMLHLVPLLSPFSKWRTGIQRSRLSETELAQLVSDGAMT